MALLRFLRFLDAEKIPPEAVDRDTLAGPGCRCRRARLPCSIGWPGVRLWTCWEWTRRNHGGRLGRRRRVVRKRRRLATAVPKRIHHPEPSRYDVTPGPQHVRYLTDPMLVRCKYEVLSNAGQAMHYGGWVMKVLQAFVRLLSGSPFLAGSAHGMVTHPIELTTVQLEQVAGGGGHPNVGSGGTNLYGGALGGVIGN